MSRYKVRTYVRRTARTHRFDKNPCFHTQIISSTYAYTYLYLPTYMRRLCACGVGVEMKFGHLLKTLSPIKSTYKIHFLCSEAFLYLPSTPTLRALRAVYSANRCASAVLMMMVTMMCGMMLRVGCVCVRYSMRYLLKYAFLAWERIKTVQRNIARKCVCLSTADVTPIYVCTISLRVK